MATSTASTAPPPSPQPGDEWVDTAHGLQFVYTLQNNGESVWVQVLPPPAGTPDPSLVTTSTPKLTSSPTPPVGPSPNDFWFDSVRGFLFIWFNDGNTIQWVVANPGQGKVAGPPGTTGSPGAPGATGPAGPAGPTGPIGLTGPSGPQGLQGATGPQGPAGVSNVPGPTGPQGPAGPQGATGAASTVAGPQGVQGPVGPAGPTGAQGPQGVQGPQGAAGAVSSVTAGTGITVTGLVATPTVAMTNVGPGAMGPIGNGTTVPVISINAQGQVTALTSTAITGGGGGTLTANSTPTSGFAAGQYLRSDGSLLQPSLMIEEAANIVAQRSGSNAQLHRIYETYTDAANYGRGHIGFNIGQFQISATALGSGTQRDMLLNAANIYANGANYQWRNAAGSTIYASLNAFALTPGTDNSLTLGSSGFRWSSIWSATPSQATNNDSVATTAYVRTALSAPAGLLRLYSETVLGSAGPTIDVTIPTNAKHIELQFSVNNVGNVDAGLNLQVMQGGTAYTGLLYNGQQLYGTISTPSTANIIAGAGFLAASGCYWAGTVRPIMWTAPIDAVIGEATLWGQNAAANRFFLAQGFSSGGGAFPAVATITGFRLVNGTAVNFAAGSFMRAFVVT